MKKIIFYISLIMAIWLLFNIIAIVTVYFDSLTNYGYGYITGRIILFLVFAVIAFFLRKSMKKEA